MTLILSGSDGLSDVDGSAATPAIRGTDTNTGIFFPAADTIAFAEGGVEAMRIDSAGNLGIGITSPVGRLSVKSTYVSDTTTQQRFEDNTGSALSFGGTGGGVKWLNVADVGTPSTGYALAFQTGGTERARITSGGSLLVGTTSTAYSSTFQISASNNFALQCLNLSSSQPRGYFSQFTAGGNDTSSYHFIGATASGDKVYILGNGNIQNVNNSYGALSDVKLKENIVDATPKLANLMQVKIRNYNLIGETTKQIGVVAQELETVFPAMVDETPDRDAENNELGTTTKSVKYSVFVPMLIKAIQEQQAIITQLQADVAALKA